MTETLNLEPEFYPIDRVLFVGPFLDVLPLADKAAAAGHTPTLLVPVEELPEAREHTKHNLLAEQEAVAADDFDLAVELHCIDLEAKADSLYFLEDSLAEDVPILTLTLAMPVSELARDLLMPERILGLCLLPPFEHAQIAELMRGEHTSDAAFTSAKRFCESIGLPPKLVQDTPGGVLVRTVCCLVNEAAYALQEQIAPAADIDTAMQLGVAYPQGPLAWGDQIGLDRVEAVMDGLHAWFKEERYRTTPLLKRLVRSGYTGVNSGRGFFTY